MHIVPSVKEILSSSLSSTLSSPSVREFSSLSITTYSFHTEEYPFVSVPNQSYYAFTIHSPGISPYPVFTNLNTTISLSIGIGNCSRHARLWHTEAFSLALAPQRRGWGCAGARIRPLVAPPSSAPGTATSYKSKL